VSVPQSCLAQVVLVALLGAGCATVSPAVVPPNPADEARAMEHARCGPDIDDAALAPVLGGQAVDAVEPHYTRVQSGMYGVGARLDGSVVHVRALQGMTAEWLDRALECHSARRVLGRVPDTMLPNDPFWLPGRMVDIDAQPARGGFVVAVRGSTLDDAQEILIRTNAFMASKASSTATP